MLQPRDSKTSVHVVRGRADAEIGVPRPSPRREAAPPTSDDLSFYDSSHDADWTLVIPDPILLQRSALSFSPRGREHAERGVGDHSTIVSLGSCIDLFSSCDDEGDEGSSQEGLGP